MHFRFFCDDAINTFFRSTNTEKGHVVHMTTKFTPNLRLNDTYPQSPRAKRLNQT